MDEHGVLNLSCKDIRKLEKTIVPFGIIPRQIKILNLSGNSLQRLDNTEIFSELTELNVSHNQLLRMYSVGKLRHLVRLDLSDNHIISIEGLKDLINLRYLNLSSNSIKVLDSTYLQKCLQLEHLDLSNNKISHITNLSNLSYLKRLYLHENEITTLRHCELYLPATIEILTLGNNNISDLNEISHLVHLYNLREFSILGNPCISMTGNNPGFDYRPFVLNWCMALQVIDGYAVDELECLKAEWLYSQGRGRKFKVGEHNSLVRYLIEVCPLTNKNLESEQERKLRLVLSKAQQYQKQLSQESPPVKCNASRTSTPKVVNKRSASAHGTPQPIMTRSVEHTPLNRTMPSSHQYNQDDYNSFIQKAEKSLSRSVNCPDVGNKTFEKRGSCPPSHIPRSLLTKGKISPCESIYLPTPDVTTRPWTAPSRSFIDPYTRQNQNKREEMCISPISEKQEIRSSDKRMIMNGPVGKNKDSVDNGERTMEFVAKYVENKNRNEAATCIQKMWRGYQTRVLDMRVARMYQQIENMRVEQHIKKMSTDIEATRAALDKEHQLQVLQMEAINALWKKISNFQSAESSTADSEKMKNLAITCENLNSEVRKLQDTLKELMTKKDSTTNAATPAATQTEIVAVHTPQEEDKKSKFPYVKLASRPSTLALTSMNTLKEEMEEHTNGIDQEGEFFSNSNDQEFKTSRLELSETTTSL